MRGLGEERRETSPAHLRTGTERETSVLTNILISVSSGDTYIGRISVFVYYYNLFIQAEVHPRSLNAGNLQFIMLEDS